MTKKELEKRVRILEEAIIDTFWMSRRYAHGRATVAPSIIREHYHKLKNIGIMIPKDETINPNKDVILPLNTESDFLHDCNI